MEVALQLSADRCERGYELNTRTLNNSRSTYSAHFGQRGSLKGRGEGGRVSAGSVQVESGI